MFHIKLSALYLYLAVDSTCPDCVSNKKSSAFTSRGNKITLTSTAIRINDHMTG